MMVIADCCFGASVYTALSDRQYGMWSRGVISGSTCRAVDVPCACACVL